MVGHQNHCEFHGRTSESFEAWAEKLVNHCIKMDKVPAAKLTSGVMMQAILDGMTVPGGQPHPFLHNLGAVHQSLVTSAACTVEQLISIGRREMSKYRQATSHFATQDENG